MDDLGSKTKRDNWGFFSYFCGVKPSVMKSHPIVIILLLAFWMIPIARAQERIRVYEGEFPISMADLGIQGPVKMVETTVSTRYDGVYEEQCGNIYYFNTKGLLTKDVRYDYMSDDRIEHLYSYDSLWRFLSRVSTDGKYLQEAVYDSLGRFSYSVFTKGDGKPKSSRRYFYDENGLCVRNEYKLTIDDWELGYELMQHLFRYDDAGHCIEKAVVEDGDTSYVERNIYDEKGNVIEQLYETINDSSTDRTIYFYNKDNLLVKSENYYNNALICEYFYEYDEHQLTDCITSYDEKGNMTSWIYVRYDEYSNPIESIWFSLDDNCRLEIRAKYTYEYEYYE